jgi:uncharacterized protein (TIGR02145 family)
MKKVTIIITLLCVAAFAQQKGSFTDPRDKKTYKTTKIGTQTWMAENLNFNASGSKCGGTVPKEEYYSLEGKNTVNCDKYGRLYNWNTALNACPKGWHLPSDADWKVLMKFVNPSCSGNSDCAKAGTLLKATSGWNKNGNGTDDYGFSALPGGAGDSSYFNYAGNYGFWWGTTEYNGSSAYLGFMLYDLEDACWDYNDKSYLLSVRCLQDHAQQKGSFTDPRDKKTYKTTKIGTQTWMAENLDYGGKNDDIGVCYNKKAENCKKWGAMYTWAEANKVCPHGWHLPSDKEWQTLVDFADGYHVAGKELKAKNGWKDGKGKSGNGDDAFGFAALPGGNSYSDGEFDNVGYYGIWWSATEYDANGANGRGMAYDLEGVYWYGGYKSFLFSVRCLQD